MLQARCNDIFISQDALNPLWVLCVVRKIPIATIAEQYDYSLDAMIENGLNRNMITRTRWFDTKTFAYLGGFAVIKRLNIDTFQYHSWQLSLSEMKEFDISWLQVAERFGEEFCREEQQRLGVCAPQIFNTPEDNVILKPPMATGVPLTTRGYNTTPMSTMNVDPDDLFMF